MVAKPAQRFGVERFVLISTDKAVNPFSVMGATKRVAELLVQAMSQGRVCSAAVRFGNVLASNGSVVPQFVEQIERGGPVTVTHPEVRRYFMLISEAVHLVLHAAALAKGSDIFVLEMGEQIRVTDLARNLIRLSGLVPDQDIAITFTGLRPGEKLSEELVGGDEPRRTHVGVGGSESAAVGALGMRPSSSVSRPSSSAWPTRATIRAVIDVLRKLVPTYRPGGSRE
mgnify:CR=1 FL=1